MNEEHKEGPQVIFTIIAPVVMIAILVVILAILFISLNNDASNLPATHATVIAYSPGGWLSSDHIVFQFDNGTTLQVDGCFAGYHVGESVELHFIGERGNLLEGICD